MPSLKLYIDESMNSEEQQGIIDETVDQFTTLPAVIQDEVVLAILLCKIVRGSKARGYFLEIRGSRNTPADVVALIANRFVSVTDVEAYRPDTGTFVFLPKGSQPVSSLDL